MFTRRARLRLAELLAGLALIPMFSGCGEREVGAVLTYEAVRDPADSATPFDELMKDLASVVEERLAGDGRVRTLPDGQFAVDVYVPADDRQLERIRRRLETMGVLEFRIMASTIFPEHAAIIDQANEQSAGDGDVVRLSDEDVARWVEPDPKEFSNQNVIDRRGMVTRQRENASQALALINDGADVTGDMLEWAGSDIDETGRPQVSFQFNAEGARLFGELTGSHVPTPDGKRYLLGMILDNRLLSAPSIESRITDRCRISGNMNEEEVNSLVAILNSGRLPCAIREIAAAPAAK